MAAAEQWIELFVEEERRPSAATVIVSKRSTVQNLIDAIHVKVAISAIGASALRGQGAAGVVAAARDYLGNMRLGEFCVSRESQFRNRLDADTEKLLRAFPSKGRSWGAARKALNLFLRDAFYNAYLRKHFGLADAEYWYELPLDSAVARGLRRLAAKRSLPPWDGLKRLKPHQSQAYQEFAATVARERGIARVHLDAYLWVAER